MHRWIMFVMIATLHCSCLLIYILYIGFGSCLSFLFQVTFHHLNAASFRLLRMPTLSNSKPYSLKYTAEQGIGVILVLEYLYFCCRQKLDKMTCRSSVSKLVTKAVQEYGENVEILCPILVDVAKAHQMSRNLNSKGR
ncbi:hypothetical protein EDC04DRAFT_1330346 [Pisolithus marmoratus]|nr:hypothetical protein EDC04DRAFT_1330346 [Pisolithus marmoratus]